MNQEIIKRFLKKNVKLVTEGYALYGEITEVQHDCIIFKTTKAVSAISLEAIDTIVLSNKEMR